MLASILVLDSCVLPQDKQMMFIFSVSKPFINSLQSTAVASYLRTEAKVTDLDVPCVRFDEYVVALEVAMDDRRLVLVEVPVLSDT